MGRLMIYQTHDDAYFCAAEASEPKGVSTRWVIENPKLDRARRFYVSSTGATIPGHICHERFKQGEEVVS